MKFYYYLHYCTETIFNYVKGQHTSIFFSEKIYKPIVLKHPFILLGRTHSLKVLREHGYKTFSPFIDESYDDIVEDHLRMDAVVRELQRLDNFSENDWLKFQENITEILEHNARVLWSKNRFSSLNDFTKLLK